MLNRILLNWPVRIAGCRRYSHLPTVLKPIIARQRQCMSYSQLRLGNLIWKKDSNGPSILTPSSGLFCYANWRRYVSPYCIRQSKWGRISTAQGWANQNDRPRADIDRAKMSQSEWGRISRSCRYGKSKHGWNWIFPYLPDRWSDDNIK